ncbi:hypothetical protein [Xanthomonas sp. WHRI 1810A]|uniref:hypothetical protein n=1 Tax=Xanthomonas sp. WHRI 1810A TaxID=3161565 RepID=UPI003F881A60
MHGAGIDTALEAALAGCAQEPIRVPGALQPHGVLMALSGDPLCIQQMSEKLYALGIESGGLPGQGCLGCHPTTRFCSSLSFAPALPGLKAIRCDLRLGLDISARHFTCATRC